MLKSRNMKQTIIVFLLCISGAASAQEATLDVGGISKLLAEKAKEAKLATMVDLSGTFGGAAYLPVWTLKGAGPAGAEYMAIGAGGMIREGGEKSPLLSLTFNLPAISAKAWDFQWAKDHIKRASFPPIWMGPYILIPTSKSYVIRTAVGGMVSVGL